MEKIVSDIGSDLMGEVYRFEVKRRGTRTQQIAPRYTQELHFNAQAVGPLYHIPSRRHPSSKISRVVLSRPLAVCVEVPLGGVWVAFGVKEADFAFWLVS